MKPLKSGYAPSLWLAYKNYVRLTVDANAGNDSTSVAYWRNAVFCNILTHVVPLSIMALVPSAYMAFSGGLAIVGIVDLLAFFLVIIITMDHRLSLQQRKFIFISISYCLSFTLLYNLSIAGPGLLFLLANTIFTSIIYSSHTAYYSAWANTIICIGVGLLIYFRIDVPIANNYNIGTWIAVSSNLILLSFICAKFLLLLLNGMENSFNKKKKLEANLTAIIENTESNIYSLDREFRYITFNQVLRNRVKQNYGIDIKPGDNVFDFLESTEPGEAVFWKDIYTKAFTGKLLRFEKDFNAGGQIYTTDFSVNPIVENNKVTGLSCFAIDITERKRSDMERHQIINDLIVRNENMQQFSFIVSHNLRSPVAHILGLTELLKYEDNPAEIDTIMNEISNAAYKLDDVIRDLNDILQIRTPIIENRQDVDLQDIVQGISPSIDYLIRKEDIIIQTDFQSAKKITAIKSYLYSIFYNLIKNSIKFRLPGQPVFIEIKSSQRPEGIQLVFKDNGLGIDLEKYQERMFGLYSRFHLQVEGKGMGLFMVKTQVEAIGGKITVASEPNKGTQFTILFKN